MDHAGFKAAFQACQAFVFPTLQDFIGRVVVEALTTGTPVVVSPMTGAVGTIVHDGVNGIVVDPRDARALAAAMHRAADPETSRALREGVRRTNAPLLPGAGRQVVLQRRRPGASGHAHGSDAPLPTVPVREVPSVPTARPMTGPVLDLRVGEIVEVRSVSRDPGHAGRAAASSTALPFMPEMLAFCGRRFRVHKLAVKLCDTIGSTGMYRMRNAVHLEGCAATARRTGAARPAASSTGRRRGSGGSPPASPGPPRRRPAAPWPR